ncbi:MAG: CDP-alcohol phosphatidyltransferase family protein [Anaerolineae bacterium]
MLTDMARARARSLLNAVAQIFISLGISPNTLTVAGFIGVCLIAVVIAAGYEAWGGLLIILAGAFDAVDGTLARATNKVTKFGAFLDSTLDRWADAALFLAILYRFVQLGDPLSIYLTVVALIGSLLVSYTRARAEGLGASIKEGWFTRLERTIILILGLILTAWVGPVAMTVAVAILAVFANITAVQRVFAARRALDGTNL